MNVSRRSFLRASSLAGVVTVAAGFPRLALAQKPAAGPSAAPLPKEVYGSALYSLSMANFRANIGSTFGFEHPTFGRIGLKLVEVGDLKPLYGRNRPADKECFALTFQGPFAAAFAQGTYQVTDSRLGPFELFIVPGDEQSPEGLLYEANVNRLYP